MRRLGLFQVGLVWASAAVWPAAGCARHERVPVGDAEKPAASSALVPAPEPPAEAPTAPLDGNVHGWDADKSYSYGMKLSTRVDFDGAGNSFDFDIVGTLEIDPATVAAGSATLRARIPDARIVTRIPGSEQELDKLAAEIRATEALFALTGGRSDALFVPNGTSQMAASTYRQLASALQFARASDGSTRYSAEEYDTIGRYVAEYSRGSSERVWQKRKLRYLAILGTESAPADVRQRVLPELSSSREELRLSENGRPLGIRLADALTLKGAQIPLTSNASVDLEAKEERPRATRLDVEALLKGTRYRADEPIRDPNAARALDKAKAGGLDFAALVERLERRAREKARAPAPQPSDKPATAAEIARNEQDVREEARLFHGLSAVLRDEPGATAKAVARVRAKSPATDAIVDALGDAGTSDAHRALAQVLTVATVSAPVEGRVILSLARTPTPTKEASDALKAVLKRHPHSAGALYGLGTHARLYRDAGKLVDANELGEFLVANFKADDGPMTTVILLRAIANSGYIGALPRVLPFLRHKDEQIRATAVRALQSMRDPRIDSLIAGRLKDDASADVRISAIDAAKVREPTESVVTALVDAGVHGENPHLRYRAVELMADWLTKRPELRATLDLVAKNDAEEKIRERAKLAL